MPRRGTRRCRYHRHLRGQQFSGGRIEAPDQREIEPRVVGDDKLSARIGRHHVQMRTVVIARRELPRRIIRPAHMMARAHARPHVSCFAQRPIRAHWEDGGAAAPIIRGEHELSRRMHADIRRRRAAGTHRTDSLDLQAIIVNGVRDDGAAVHALVVVDFADGIEPRLRRIHGQPGRVANVIDDLQLGQCRGRRVEPE